MITFISIEAVIVFDSLLIVTIVVPIFLAFITPFLTVATSSSLLVQIGFSIAVFSGTELVTNVTVFPT